MKIYTKTGDLGMTGLYDGKRKSKSELIFDVLGTLDEFSAHIGMLVSYMTIENLITIGGVLRNIQRDLLDIGSVVATEKKNMDKYAITEEKILSIESAIDEMEKNNTPLTKFILVGVKPLDSQAHICRAVCRRLEREIIRYSQEGDLLVNPPLENKLQTEIKYINRLSDYFFVLARYLSECKEIVR